MQCYAIDAIAINLQLTMCNLAAFSRQFVVWVAKHGVFCSDCRKLDPYADCEKQTNICLILSH